MRRHFCSITLFRVSSQLRSLRYLPARLYKPHRRRRSASAVAAIVLVVAFPSLGIAQSTGVCYDASSNLLPQSPWTFTSGGNPSPSVAGGLLHETTTIGGEYWLSPDPTVDFSQRFTLDAKLRVNSSNYVPNVGTGTREGYYLYAQDKNGNIYSVGLASGGFNINSVAVPNQPLTPFPVAGAFHTYHLEIVNNSGTFSIDGGVVAAGIPPDTHNAQFHLPPEVIFGGLAGASVSDTDLSYFCYNHSPPLTSVLTLTLNPSTIPPYILASSPGVPLGPPQPVMIEATLDPPPVAGQLVTFSIDPSDFETSGHLHINTFLAALNHYAFEDDTGSIIAPACTTDPPSGKCHVLLITAGSGCGGTADGAPPKVSNGWCEVSGDYVVSASAAAVSASPQLLSVRNLPTFSFLPLTGLHYITAISPFAQIFHPSFTWAVSPMVSQVQCFANKFWDNSGHYVLSFNDLSLPSGGLFDIDTDWHTPHLFHRLGRSVDVNHHTENSDPNLPSRELTDSDDDLLRAANDCFLVSIEEGGPIHFELDSTKFP